MTSGTAVVDTGGGVLPLVLILVIALELMAHGALLMARQEEAASRVGAGLLQARLAARAGVRTTADPVAQAYLDVPIWGVADGPRGALGSGHFRVRARRLSRERWWWVAEGGTKGHLGTTRTAMMVWLPDPVARLRDFGAVVVVGAGSPVSGAVRIDASSLRRDGAPLDPTPCTPWGAELDSLFLGTITPSATAEAMDVPREPTLGKLDRDRLLAWLPGAAPGDLVLDHEVGQGLLVVAGDVVIEGGRHEGVVLSGGRLTLRDGATLVGFARAAGGVDIEPGSVVVGSGCRALLALSTGLAEWVRYLPMPPGPFEPY